MKKKPNHLKIISGSKLPLDSHVEIPTVSETPQPPDWLTDVEALKEFDRLAPVLTSVGILSVIGVIPLAHLCAVHGKLVEIWKSGECPSGFMLAQYRTLINDFGLTPVSQMKIKSPDKKQNNEFESLKKLQI